LNPLSSIFRAGVGMRNRLYDRGKLRAHRLQAPVLSVGSISAGGAGKTPFLIMLGGLLQQRGITFNVLSRGYGRRTQGVALVDPAGSARQFGDEPLLIARQLSVPVIVGEDRYAAGQFAEGKFGLHAHLLDDGFQHRRLARDFDIVLITERDLEDSLLPVGRLREPLAAVARASAIVLMDKVGANQVPLRDGQQVWRVSRGIVAPQTTAACLAFCGIARPQNFFAELDDAGIRLAGTQAFPDHHPYDANDVKLLVNRRQRAGAEAFVTTEKDVANLGSYLPQLEPVHVVPVRMQFVDASPVEPLCSFVLRQKEIA
jgi:tetraacyldisaccharide 4'-kinase